MRGVQLILKHLKKKAWMSNDCLHLKCEVRSLGKCVATEPNKNPLRFAYCSCKKAYKVAVVMVPKP